MIYTQEHVDTVSTAAANVWEPGVYGWSVV
jgi:hypothetical protein